MITVVQRVTRACVQVDGEMVGRIRHGLVAFVAVVKGDTEHDAETTAERLHHLRVFGDENVIHVKSAVLTIPSEPNTVPVVVSDYGVRIQRSAESVTDVQSRHEGGL